MSHVVCLVGCALGAAACSYGVTFADCEVSCPNGGDDACPDGFSCVAGLCRIEGAGESCEAPGELTLRQTADDVVARNLVFGCTNADQTTADGSWYRVFALPEAGVTTPFDLSKITFGLCFAVGTPTLGVRVGTYEGNANDVMLEVSRITPLATENVEIAPTQISRLVEVPLEATIPAGANLIVEIQVPDLVGTGQEVNVGFTVGGENRPGYVRSPLCGPATPTTTTAANLANARLVLTATGAPR
jgi:hypothetical protein